MEAQFSPGFLQVFSRFKTTCRCLDLYRLYTAYVLPSVACVLASTFSEEPMGREIENLLALLTSPHAMLFVYAVSTAHALLLQALTKICDWLYLTSASG